MVHSLLARDLKLVPTEAILFPMEASLLVSLVEANLAPTEDRTKEHSLLVPSVAHNSAPTA
jgi:hypothetical protein